VEIIPGRALLLNLPWKERDPHRILGIYAPNSPGDNTAFWESLSQKWNESNLPRLDLLLGDFNVVEEGADCQPAHEDNERTVESLQNFKSSFLLWDGWRATHPTKLSYTCLQTARTTHSRIDRIYVTDKILVSVVNGKYHQPPSERTMTWSP